MATARKAEIPIFVEALGTVTPSATVTVKPQAAGLSTQVLFNLVVRFTKGITK